MQKKKHNLNQHLCETTKVYFIIIFIKIDYLAYSINDSDLYYDLFPADFKFGVATASYQIEGGKELRGINIWDKFTHDPTNIEGNSQTFYLHFI